MKTHAVAMVVTLFVGCGSSTPPCDSTTFTRCYGGAVHLQGCVEPTIVTTCANGCIEEGAAGSVACPEALCREPGPKVAGDPCQTGADCLPTPATVSSTEVTNTYLTCDTATHSCVAADAPVVADWLKPCSPDLIEHILAVQIDAGASHGLDGTTFDATCVSSVCAIHREAGASCIANACTRVCFGDHECPPGSTCVGALAGAVPAACSGTQGYCKPGGPNGIGFTCR